MVKEGRGVWRLSVSEAEWGAKRREQERDLERERPRGPTQGGEWPRHNCQGLQDD